MSALREGFTGLESYDVLAKQCDFHDSWLIYLHIVKFVHKAQFVYAVRPWYIIGFKGALCNILAVSFPNSCSPFCAMWRFMSKFSFGGRPKNRMELSNGI